MAWHISQFLGIALSTTALAQAATPPQKVDFRRDVAPILEQSCMRCHGPGVARGNVTMTRAGLLEGGYVNPGQPDHSALLDVVTAQPGKRPEMPKQGPPLTGAQAAILRQWVTEGADWPDGPELRDTARADASWWSLQPLAPVRPPDPPGLPEGWSANPIDRFVYAKLAEKQLQPSPPADRRSLIRRLSYDLIGLPPTPEEVDAFATDSSPGAYEKLVDRLLASPRYGEKWGRHWLDVVRFGESNGYERNILINNVWPFRDYIIKSFSEDKPFDRLILEHLAGDVIAEEGNEGQVGTAFLVCGPYDNVGNSDPAAAAVIRADTIDEMIRATSEAFMGLTMGCARCHDHKFDPITQKDYHAMYATFAGVQHGERVILTPSERKEVEEQSRMLSVQRDKLVGERESTRKLIAVDPAEEITGLKQRLEEVQKLIRELNRQIEQQSGQSRVWAGNFVAAPGPFHVFTGGDPQKKGEKVEPGSLSALEKMSSRYRLTVSEPESERRLALAKWLVAPDNPLTPRVLVNRLWHYHFGTGIVDSPGDFGYMGGRPTHPELLDWLARQIMANGWRLKPMHRMIVLSQTYRQASVYREDAAQVDADARLLWRFPSRRLTGEEVRDTILSIAGTLRLEPAGGYGFTLYKYVEDNVATYYPLDEHPPETYRRAVYHMNARSARVDVLSDFDCPDPAFAAQRRASTTTPLQALALMNHRFTLDMASALARRLEQEAPGNPSAQVQRAFVLSFSREGQPEELAAAQKLVEKHGLTAFCLALLNTNELVYLR